MSRRFEREPEGAGGERSSTSMARLLGQMLLLPFSVFVYSLELFVRTAQGVERVAGQEFDLTAGAAPRGGDARPGQTQVTAGAVAQAASGASGRWGDVTGYQEPRATDAAAPAAFGDDLPAGTETVSGDKTKETEMDRDLRDDMLKLVRYKVLFVKREYEHAFPEQEDLVSENMDGAAFTAWKVAEFIQRLQRRPREVRVPGRWGRGYPEGHREGEWLTGLPDDDKKYLRVYYEVMDRYPREKFKYEEQQISVLREIRDEIRDCNDDRGGSSSDTGTSSGGTGQQ